RLRQRRADHRRLARPGAAGGRVLRACFGRRRGRSAPAGRAGPRRAQCSLCRGGDRPWPEGPRSGGRAVRGAAAGASGGRGDRAVARMVNSEFSHRSAKMSLLVMKFGGTSVGGAAAIEALAAITRDQRAAWGRVVVVVSAMS